ncbi:MAG: right-handed parallel beta-helix repeat-containing protein [Nitrososphaerales archaeon]
MRANIGPCSGAGLVIGHSGITLNCAGHTITGKGSQLLSGIYLAEVSGDTVKNCNVTGFYNGFSLFQTRATVFEGNSVKNDSDAAYYLEESNYNSFLGNSANQNGFNQFGQFGAFGNGFVTDDSSHNDFVGNTVTDFGTSVLDMVGFAFDSQSNYNGVTNNNASSDTLGFAIYGSNNNFVSNIANGDTLGFWVLTPAINNLFKTNVVDHDLYGFVLESCTNNNLNGNTANSDNTGFEVEYGSSSNTLIGNNANDNVFGFYLVNSTSNTFTGDSANRNTVDGFYLDGSSSGNTLNWNSANDNTQHGYYDASTSATTTSPDWGTGNSYANDYGYANVIGLAGGNVYIAAVTSPF